MLRPLVRGDNPRTLAHYQTFFFLLFPSGVVGWCDCAGKTSSTGCSTNLEALAVGAGGVVWTFSPCLSFLFPNSLSLGDCLKGPLSPKQTTNQPTLSLSGRRSGIDFKILSQRAVKPETTNQSAANVLQFVVSSTGGIMSK